MLATIQSQSLMLQRQYKATNNPLEKRRIKARADYLAVLSITPLSEIDVDDIEFVYEKDLS